MTKPYYVTTPIYYVNDVPHIGHAYTTVAADVLVRWRRLRGHKVYFLTGTDEHGQKIDQVARQAGLTPQAWADKTSESFRRLWDILGIGHDDFIRTTEPRHEKAVREFFSRLQASGDIYKGHYEDWYCVGCETFLSETQLVDRKCPDCGRAVERLREESYFFKLSKYEKPLLDFYAENPGFLQPAHRANEILSFVKSGLKDLSVSRTKVSWGVPLPDDPGHTVYVWFDALINYVSATGFPDNKDGFELLWPADVHFVGKEIFRFHTVIWPAMLMALGLPLPKKVFAHGWWTVEGEKMSKSKGNVVDPAEVSKEFGVGPLRYFLLKEVPFGSDGDFSRKALLGRYNAELANALGNLLNRTLNLIEKNLGGEIPSLRPDPDFFGPAPVKAWTASIEDAFDRLSFHEVLQKVQELVDKGNQHVNEKEPWKLVKTDAPAAARCLYEVARLLKAVALTLSPFMPAAANEMLRQLGETALPMEAAAGLFDRGEIDFAPGQKVFKGDPLFPRKDGKDKT